MMFMSNAHTNFTVIHVLIIFFIITVSSSSSSSSSLSSSSSKSSSSSINFTYAKELLHSVANLIYHRYELNRNDSEQFFLEVCGIIFLTITIIIISHHHHYHYHHHHHHHQQVSNIPSYSWDIQKYKIALKILQSMQSQR